MAEQGRREVVPDQLAFNAREQAPERTLATMGVRNPGATGGPTRSASRALEGLYGALGNMAEAISDDMLVQGKLDWVQGASEQQALATGGHFGQQGWRAMDTVDRGNTWYLNKVEGLASGDDQMDPETYKQNLMKEYSDNLGSMDDPAIRKLYVSTFEDKAPSLIAKQYEAHMAWNQNQAVNKFSSALTSGSVANVDATRVMPGSTLRVSPTRIDTAIMGNESDRDAGILTMLGEAAGEGDTGMAAVAHVIKNRVTDKRWGGSVTNVVKAPKQFSTWNSGAGGNGPERWRGTAAYEKAGQIYDAVMNGYTADMTNGATHYYSPQGMKKLVADGAQGNLTPGWLAAETARSRGGIKIGGHIFAGKSGMAGYTPQYEQAMDGSGIMEIPAVQGELIFAHKGQEGIDEGFASILKESAGAMQMPYKITSGHRDALHPVEAAKSSPGEHAHKDAVDIDLSGMSDEQRKAVIADLRSRGVKRFGLYSSSPNMLHVDMNAKGGNVDERGNWFMYDRSNGNMDKAPKWYQELAQSDTGQPLPKGSQPQIRSLIDASPLPPQLKASALADAIRRQLDQGSDQLWNDAGGVGVLYELGAKANEIDEVLKAKERQEKKALDGYDTAFERERNDLMTRVKSGEFTTPDQIIDAVDSMYQNKRTSGQQAQSLVRAALSEYEQVRQGEDAVLPKSFMEGVAGIFRKQDGGLLTTAEAYDEVVALGKENDVDPKTAQRFLQKVYSVDDAKYARDRSDAETALKKKLKDDDLKTRAMQAIANGKGGANIPDGTVEHNGVSMSTKEFAIEQVKDDIRKSIQAGIANGDIDGTDEDKVTGLFYKTLYTTLAHNDLVDESGGAAFTTSLRGGITEKGPGGQLVVRKDALTAFDTYLTISNDPNISNSYLARMFPDDKVRGMLEQSKKFYGNNLDLGTAMIKAEEVIANGTDPEKISHEYYAQVQQKSEEAILKAIGNNNWWRDKLPVFIDGRAIFDKTAPEYEKMLLTNEKSKATTYIRTRADGYNAMQPGQDPEVSITLAMQDFENDAIQVRGQLLIGDHRRGMRIDQKMFTDAEGKPLSYDKSAVQDAINHTLELKGSEFWPEYWMQGADANRAKWWHRDYDPSGNLKMPVNVTYNPNGGIIGLQFHDGKGQPKGDTIYLSAKEIGDTYRYDYLDKPGTLGKMYDRGMDALARGPSLGEVLDNSFGAAR